METQIANLPTEVTFVMPNVEELGRLKDMRPEFSLTLKYKKAEDWALLKDQGICAYYMGLKEIPNKDGELVKCAVFVAEKECFLAGAQLIVEAVRRLEIKTPVRLTYRGKKSNKSTEGETMIFDVETLI